MLESLVASLLNRFLGAYVKNFDPKQLNIGIWSGDVKLRNLQLKKEALDKFRLPIDVTYGHLGQLTLQIPWSNLKNKPVQILIEDVFVLASPKEEQNYDEDEEEQRMQAVKQEKLDSAEILNSKSTAGMSEEEVQKNQSFTDSLVTKIVDNLQVTIKNIHVRYEDTLSNPGHPFAVGISLAELSAVSTDGNWEPKFIQRSSNLTHKLSKLEALTVYWNTDSDNWQTMPINEIVAAFRKHIAANDFVSGEHQFILKPVTGSGKIVLNKVNTYDKPKTKATLLFEELGFNLDEDQYRDALMMLDLFHFYIRNQQYRKFRPKNCTPKSDARAWLMFAFKAIHNEVHERNYKWTWAYFAERRDDRKSYVDFFKKSSLQTISPEGSESLKQLEEKLSYEDVRFYRSLARNQMRKESAVAPKPDAAANQGWLAWAWGGGQKSASESSAVLSDQQKQELYDAIDWDERKTISEAVDLPKDWVKLEIDALLKKGSFALLREPHGKARKIFSLLFDSFTASFTERPSSMLAAISLADFQAFDGTTEGNLYPQIIKVKDQKALSPGKQETSSFSEDDGLFRATFEKNPLDESADTAITAHLKSMEIVYNVKFVEDIFRFFKPPTTQMESVSALMEAASATVEGLRAQTRAGLEFALQEHKTINAHLDLQAPLIVLPESVTERGAECLLIDAGHISLLSDLVQKSRSQELMKSQSEALDQQQFENLEALMYDKFMLKLESTQVLIGPSVEETLDELNSHKQLKHYHIVDQINMDFQVEVSILPKASTLTKFRVSGHLPQLHASMSDTKYKAMMRIIDAVIPHFEDTPTAQNAAIAPIGLQKPSETSTRRRTFSYSAQEELILSDQESDGVSEDKFEEAHDASDNSSNVNQRIFQFTFNVDELRGSMYKSDEAGKPDRLLVNLVLEGFSLDFYTRPFDMVADVVLKSLTVEDHIDRNASPEFKNLVTSKSLQGSGQQDLVRVKYRKVQKDSPEYMIVYDGIDQNVDISVSTVNIIVTRQSLLTLLDFTLTTFTDSSSIQPDTSSTAVFKVSNPDDATKKIRVKVDLSSIVLILNNDGVRLATLTLSQGDIGVFIMGKTLRVGAKIGDFELLDEINLGASKDSRFRKLVSCEKGDLADFRYETFDPESGRNYPGYDSSVYLRAGSLQVNFVEAPFRQLLEYSAKFGRMKSMYDSARNAAMEQAAQLQETTAKMHFDVQVKTPIIVFPRLNISEDEEKRDLMKMFLGELYAENVFVPVNDSQDSPMANRISAGVRETRLTSQTVMPSGKTEQLQMLENVDIGFSITLVDGDRGDSRPQTEVEGYMSDMNVKINEIQYKFLYELSKSVSNVFGALAAEEDSEGVEDKGQKEPSADVTMPDLVESPSAKASQSAVDLNPEIIPADQPGKSQAEKPSLDFIFEVGNIELELFNKTKALGLSHASGESLSIFKLLHTIMKLRMMKDGSIESELQIKTFTVNDSREQGENKFTEIIPAIQHDGSQFMASMTMSATPEKSMIVILTVDSPRVIFALDYIFALQQFAISPFVEDEETDLSAALAEDYLDDISDDDESALTSKLSKGAQNVSKNDIDDANQTKFSLAFRINIVDASLVLIANPKSTTSEAIVLSTSQILFSQQSVLALSINSIGMYFCRMDKFNENNLRILDDFNVTLTLDSRSKTPQQLLTSIQINVDPLVMRVSLRDILLALSIVTKASELSGASEQIPEEKKSSYSKFQDKRTVSQSQTMRKRTGSGRAVSTATKKPLPVLTRTDSTKIVRSGKVEAIVKREELRAEFEGVRLVLIGDLHELPILDMSVRSFIVTAKDWTSDFAVESSFDTFVNMYSYSKSAWEPLFEPWSFALQLETKGIPRSLHVGLKSHKRLELTITSEMIATFSKAAQFLSQDDDDILAKPRGADAPYRMHNETGHPMSIWIEKKASSEQSAVKLGDDEMVPWRFEDWRKVRETLSLEAEESTIGLKFDDTEWDSVQDIFVNSVGQTLYALKPTKNKVPHRLLVDVSLSSDNVKHVTFRSTLVLENITDIPIEMVVVDQNDTHLSRIFKIAPSGHAAVPIQMAQSSYLKIRPDAGFGFQWCDGLIFWKNLLDDPSRCIRCAPSDTNDSPPFFFQMYAKYDKDDPHTRMSLCLRAPVEIQNLLPYDFKYRIYDKNTKKDWTNFLRKGGLSPVHVVELSHLLLLGIQMEDTPYKPSDFGIINAKKAGEFERETHLVATDDEGLKLTLKLHYLEFPDGGGAFRVAVSCPYVILNKTGLDIQVKSKAFLQQAKTTAGQLKPVASGEHTAAPYMFSYRTEERANRAVLRVGDSSWSRPQSFEAIGSVIDVVLLAPEKRKEIHVGIAVDEGEGKYKMTNVVTITPRFILKSKLSEDIIVREPGSSDFMTLKPDCLQPLHFLRQAPEKQLTLCFPGMNNECSSPFNISNLGRVHVKLAKRGEHQRLIKVEILIEQATVFLHLAFEDKQWPFSVRNESDLEFVFYQADVSEQEQVLQSSRQASRPKKYRIPSRSIMPYAWDHPAAKDKEIVIVGNGHERHIHLEEIGTLVPMKVPINGRQRIINIDVIADGPTQVLKLSNYKPSTSLYKPKSNTSSTNLSSEAFEVTDLDSDITFKFSVNLEGIGISLITKRMNELAYLTFRGLDFKYTDSKVYQSLNTRIKWIQMDNQLYGGIYPIIMFPSVVPKTAKEMEIHPIFHFSVTRVKDDSHGVLYIKYLTVLLQQMTVDIDEDFLFAVLDYAKVPGASWDEQKEGMLCGDSLQIPEPKSDTSGKDVYFEVLHLQPAQMDLSFVRTERINVEDKTTSRNPLMFFFNILTMAIGNINDAPVKLNALLMENVRVSAPVLVQNIQSHYGQEFFYQIHKILGSADFLGNPVGLFNNISSGVLDIFYEPYQGYVMSDRPQELGIGLAKGTASFVKKSVFGVTDSISKFTGSISKGLSVATLDKQFQDRRRITRSRNRPKHALYGVTAGANSLVTSVASGFEGLARKPLEGAEKEGASGFFKGVGKGLLGFATKPAIGVFDLASNITEGIRNTTTVFDAEGIDRVRLTRFVGADRVVRPYSQREALGQFWLKQLNSGQYFNEEYLAHLDLPGEEAVIILTYTCILMVKSKRLESAWEVILKDLQTIALEKTGIALILRGGVQGPFIPIASTSSRMFLYKKIELAVKEYNSRYRV